MPPDAVRLYAELEARLAALIRPQPFSARNNLRLERISTLLRQLGDPHHHFQSVHIGGTSGKGSTAALTEAILRHHGRRTGLHMSPHLQLLNERHQLDGRPAPTSTLLQCWPAIEEHAQGEHAPFGPPSYFEAQVALSMVLFSVAQVQTAVVEVGLGGTLDATNVIPAEVAVLTNVGLDHTEILGDTPLQIATDKAGIIKPGQQVFSAVTQPEVRAHLRERCTQANASLHMLNEDIHIHPQPSGAFEVVLPGQTLRDMAVQMAGDFQTINAALALGAARAALGHDLDPARARNALLSVQLPGRTEAVQNTPLVILDGAHNPDKIRAAAQNIPPRSGRRVAVVALKAGKDAADILSVVQQHTDHIILTRFRDKGLWQCISPDEMQHHAPHTTIVDDPDQAVASAIDQAGSDGLVWVTGSLYLIGDVRARWFPTTTYLNSLEP